MKAQSVESSARPEVILLVDDEEGLRDLFSRVLTKRGFQVLQAEGPAQAIEEAEAFDGPIDVVVSDISFKGMNGRELASRLRERRPMMRVLLMSGYSSEVLSDTGGLPQDFAFLQKPFTAGELAEKVRETLDSGRREIA